MNYIKNRFYNLKNDKILLFSIIFNLMLFGLHHYQWMDSGSYKPLVRMIFCLLYPLIIFFLGRNGFYYYFFVYGNFLALTCTFQNYTAFVILTIFTIYKPKMKYTTLILYVLDIIVISTLREKTPIHLAIHFINCIFVYFALTRTLVVKYKKLDLLPDEIRILEKLAAGCAQKEIEFFSPNTVCNKLKAARIRNNFNSNDDLILAFINEKNDKDISA